MSEPTLETMRPNPVWTPAGFEDAVTTFERLADRIRIRVWGGDWCPDCRSQLPDFAAALVAAEVPAHRIDEHPVEKADDGSKIGPGVEAYGIENVPTVVVIEDGGEVARFVEEADVPIVVHLARQLQDVA